MKLFKKTAHCLSVEEETYNWAPAKSIISTRTFILLTLIAIAGVVIVSISG